MSNEIIEEKITCTYCANALSVLESANEDLDTNS